MLSKSLGNRLKEWVRFFAHSLHSIIFGRQDDIEAVN